MISRKQFLKTATVALAGIPFTTLMQRKQDREASGISCSTGEDILGPFYRANAPFRIALNILNEAGTPIFIQGKVLGGKDCKLPLIGAVLDVWHADDAGAYDNTSSDFKFRGRITADEHGDYAFMSILPAAYDNGGQYRPKHIHYLVAAEQHESLITQLYFEGDKYIAQDPWASKAEAGRIIPLTETEGVLQGSFHIYLQPV